MLIPELSPRVEKRDEYFRSGVKRSHVRAFVAVAGKARERKVAFICGTAMLRRYDVIWLVGVQGDSRRQSAVFAAVSCPLGDEAAESSWNVD